MRRRGAVFFFLAAVAGALTPGRSPGAESAWLRAATPNFELFTTDGEKRARDAIIYFEQVRAFFVNTATNLVLPTYPVRIVGFRSEKEFSPYRPFAGVAGLYHGGAHHDTIVMQGLAPALYPVAVHEYVHLILRHGNVKGGLWLHEGLAEFYSTLTPVGRDSIRVGDIPPARQAALLQRRWLDLETLFAMNQPSLAAAGRDGLSMFYAQSWALTHMLTLSDAYRTTFPELLHALFEGEEPAGAIQKTYGKSLAQVRTDLDSYIRSYLFKAALFRSTPGKPAEQPEVRPATPIEQGMVLADLDAGRPEKRELARQAYTRLAAAHPRSWEPSAGLAYLALAVGEREEAGRQFARAEELGSPDHRIYLHWGMYAPPFQEPQQVVRIFEKAVELRPDDPETVYRAGLALYRAQDCKAALEQLRRLKKVTAEQAPDYLRALAMCSYDAGLEKESKTAASQLLTIARTPAERESAQALVDLVNRPRWQPAAEDDAQASPPPQPPRVESRAPPPPEPKAVEGLLVQVDCQGAGARLWLQTEGRKLAFLIPRGNAISLRRGGQDMLGDLQCGPQPKPEKATIRYDEMVDAAGSQNIVRVLEFP